MNDIKITEDERAILDEELNYMSLGGNLSINYNSVKFDMSININPEIGKDKTFLYLRQQLKYNMQILKKDLEKSFYTE